MKLLSSYNNVTCVYKVTCIENNKILIGCTTNLYNRIKHYRSDINKSNPLKYYNISFYNDLSKYGIDSFNIEILEQFDDISDKELKNKEAYYMDLYNSLDPNIGYNIRKDIDGHCICSDSTREIKRQQTKLQWKLGIRNGHSDKMKIYWKNSDNSRKEKQSLTMSENKTKYSYTIYDNKNNILKENISYNDLNIEGFDKSQIISKFCYVAKKPITDKIILIYGDDIESYRNTITLGKYRIRRFKI